MKIYNLLFIVTLITSLQASFLGDFDSINDFEYKNSCIDKCFDDKENYFKCLLNTAAKNVYNEKFKNEIASGTMTNFEDLELDQFLSLIKQNNEVIKDLVLAYNSKDIEKRQIDNNTRDYIDVECAVINEDKLIEFLNLLSRMMDSI
jgi:hypothetical protein